MENIRLSAHRTPAQKKLVLTIWKDDKVMWKKSYSADSTFPLEPDKKSVHEGHCWKDKNTQAAWEVRAYVSGGGNLIIWVMYDVEEGKVHTQVSYSDFKSYSV